MTGYTTWYSGSTQFEIAFPEDLSPLRIDMPQTYTGVNDGSSFFIDTTGMVQYTGSVPNVFNVKYTFTIEPASKATGLRLWISKNSSTVFNDEGQASICFDNTAFINSPSIGQLSFAISDTVLLNPFETVQLMGQALKDDSYQQDWIISNICGQIYGIS